MTASPRKTPEHQPWQIVASGPAGTVGLTEAEAAQTYDALSKCEAACKALAISCPGTTFRPVKYGKPYLAQKVEKVVLQ